MPVISFYYASLELTQLPVGLYLKRVFWLMEYTGNNFGFDSYLTRQAVFGSQENEKKNNNNK